MLTLSQQAQVALVSVVSRKSLARRRMCEACLRTKCTSCTDVARTGGEVLQRGRGGAVVVQEFGRGDDQRPLVRQVGLPPQRVEVLRGRRRHDDKHVGVALCLSPDELQVKGSVTTRRLDVSAICSNGVAGSCCEADVLLLGTPSCSTFCGLISG